MALNPKQARSSVASAGHLAQPANADTRLHVSQDQVEAYAFQAGQLMAGTAAPGRPDPAAADTAVAEGAEPGKAKGAKAKPKSDQPVYNKDGSLRRKPGPKGRDLREGSLYLPLELWDRLDAVVAAQTRWRSRNVCIEDAILDWLANEEPKLVREGRLRGTAVDLPPASLDALDAPIPPDVEQRVVMKIFGKFANKLL